MPEDASRSEPSPGQWFLIWLRIGLQSFGGGVATIALIRQELVERGKWVTPEEFVRDFALCQLCPGVNILALSVIFGKRLGGPFGIPLALGGLLVPSAAATACLTAAYAHVKNSPVVESALRFVMPVVAGLGVSTAIQTAESPIRQSRREGSVSLFVSLGLVAVAGLVVAVWKFPTPYALVGSAAIGACWVYARRRQGKVKA